MNYNDLLSSTPLLDIYPQNIIIVKNSDDSMNILFVNNQLLGGIGKDGPNEMLESAIKKYLNENDNAKLAKVYIKKNENDLVFSKDILK